MLTKTLIMVSGIVIIILLPSAIFYYNEDGWTYLDCIYYALVSLSTRGLGNLTNSRNSGEVLQEERKWRWVYQAFTMLWFILGLSFFSMVNTFTMETIGQISEKRATVTKEEMKQIENAIRRRRATIW